MAIIDDADEVLITYEPEVAWTKMYTGTPFDIRITQFDSVHEASKAGSKATVRFIGTSVQVGTILWPSGGNCSIVLDGRSVGTYNTGVPTTKEGVSRAVFNRTGLDVNFLHTITISKEADDPSWRNPVDGNTTSHLWLDFFSTDGTVPVPVSTSKLAGITSTASSSVTQANIFTTSNPYPNDSPVLTLPLPFIIVPVLGVVGLAILVFIVCRRRLRQRKNGVQSQHAYGRSGENTENPSSVRLITDVTPIPPITPFPSTNAMPSTSFVQEGKRPLPIPKSRQRRTNSVGSSSAPLDSTMARTTFLSGTETHMTTSEDPSQSAVTWIDPWPVPGTVLSSTPVSTSFQSPVPHLGEVASSSSHSDVKNPFESTEEREGGRGDRDVLVGGVNEKALFQRNENASSSAFIGATMTTNPPSSTSLAIVPSIDTQSTAVVRQEIDVLMGRVRHLKRLVGGRGEPPREPSEYMEAPPRIR